MSTVNGKYLKDENNAIVSPVVSTDTVFDGNGKSLTEKLNSGEFKLAVNPTDTSNLNIWIETS